MRKSVALFLALLFNMALFAQKPLPPHFESVKALLPYEKKIQTLQNDLYELTGKLNCDDQFTCIALIKDMEILRLRIKTSLIIAFMYQEGSEQGAKFSGGDIKLDYFETQTILGNGSKFTKKALATVKNPLLAQLGLEGTRMMESSLEEIEKLYKAVKAPTSLF